MNIPIKKLWLSPILTLIFCATSSASGGLGKELNIRTEQGQATFGSQFAYDIDVAWVMNYATTITNAELSVLPKTLKWNLYEFKSGKYLVSWQDIQKENLMIGTMRLEGWAIKTVLANLKSIVLVFAIEDQGARLPMYFLNTGKLCQTLPDHYHNLTLGKTGCDLE